MRRYTLAVLMLAAVAVGIALYPGATPVAHSPEPLHAEPVAVAQNDLPMWTIYDRPTDYPDGFVVRKWVVKADATIHCGEVVGTAKTLAEARRLVPAGKFRKPRDRGDDAKIVETWL